MSSFFKQAEALSAVEAQEVVAVVPSQELKKEQAPVTAISTASATREKEKPVASPVKSAEVLSKPADAARETVSPGFFNRVTEELAEINGPLASMMIHDHVTALGESIEKFPKARVPELVKILSEEITDENMKIGFRKRIGEKS